MPVMRGSRAAVFGGINAPPGPLDVAGGALGAFGLRALSRSYALNGGPFADLRRSTDNAAMTAYAMRNGKFPISSLLAWAGSASVYVSKWYDQSGNGYHAAQSTAANQPMIVNAGALVTQNGQPSLLFSGNNNSGFSQAPIIPSMLTNNLYLNVVFNPITKVGGLLSWRGGSTNAAATFSCDTSAGNNPYMTYNWNDIASTWQYYGQSVSLNTNYVAEAAYSPSSTSLFLNGSSVTNSVANTPSPPTNASGKGLDIASDYYQGSLAGNIGEIVIALSSASRAAIHGNQQAYWGFG